ncbi:AraC family transcriptional regulator [Clostridium saccharoperbutylacetonicum]|uniref:AraC family transcriptional regulator n=1 Tax=Clostridium saccharoperbutylacetonicum TaxID=36745 RepID=UPI000983F04E|nr:AraC family transcriptional regulator [Clostridium saccharoperbutylacetonicum]AQR93550.1 arabinose operon regulatory protein [Clostridium saccharoperbutylacetonicum]NSB29249.1 AraC-like DNA-binding protein [Clostridium saccharoperbutylacetonicum]
MNEDMNMEYFSTINDDGFDITVYQCGMEKCKKSHSYGPAIRDHYLIHFVLEGSGIFYVDGKSYKIKANQGFLICPNIVTYYEADKEEPWIYTWVGFKGIKAEKYLKLANLDQENPIFECTEVAFVQECFENMRKSTELKYGRELRLQGLLIMFLSELIEEAGKNVIISSNYKEMYIKKSLQFVEINYSSKISISEMAKSVGLNKNYFSTFFRENIGVSPQQYIIKYRINKACELMSNQGLTIGDISRSVGYDDTLGFSKIFKKEKGISPKKYRQKVLF